jgi:hypothetical protein
MRGLVQLFLVQSTSDGTFHHQDIAKIKVTSEIWTKGDLQRCDDNLTKKKEKHGNDPTSDTHTLRLQWINFQQTSQVKKPIMKTHETHMESTMEHIVN